MQAAEEKQSKDEAQSTLSSVRILFFVEKESYLHHFKAIFRMCGLKSVQEATRLPEVINFLISKNYDIIIVTHLGQASDANLLIEEIKGIEGTADLPLAVITSGQGGVKDILSLYSKGVDEVMLSPFSSKVLENTVSRLMKHRKHSSPEQKELAKARELIGMGEIDRARERFSALIDKESCLLDAHLGLYQVYRQKQQWQPAAAHLKHAFEIAKMRGDETLLEKAKLYMDLATVYHNFADYYHQRGQAEKALKNYRFAIKLNPFHIESIIALLSFMRSPTEAAEITKLLNEITKAFVPFSSPLENIGVELDKLADKFINLNMFENALAVHQLLSGIAHGNAAVCQKNADFLLGQGEVSTVVKMLIKFCDKLTDHDVLVKAAQIFMDVENYHTEKSPVQQPDDRVVAHKDLSFFSNMKKDEIIARAKEMFQQALLIEPESTRCWVDIVRCYLRMKNEAKANELVNKLLNNHKEDEQLTADIIKAMLNDHAFDLVKPYLTIALERFPQNGCFYEYMAIFYRAQNKPYDAISFIKKAYSIQPDRTGLLILLGETYYDIQDYSNAIIFYEKAAEQGGDDPHVEEGLQKALRAKQIQENKK